ncbi:MAG: nucleotidyltransferase family protein [Lentisphaerae bacterium]|jgi:hypothetical protein|nr:nucleotidyltransferase family protein [Lentisphaerota bacterium]
MSIINELKAIVRTFEQENIDYALCGGLAMAVYNFPRATLDIDLMLQVDSLIRATNALKTLGFTMDAAPMSFKDGQVQIYRLIKPLHSAGEILMIDLLIVTPATSDAWHSRKTVKWEDGILKIVSPQGLINLKSLRLSGTDQDDIAHLESIVNDN